MGTQGAQSVRGAGQLVFDCTPGRGVVLQPTAGQLTSDAGLLAVRQFDERLGWTAIRSPLARTSVKGRNSGLVRRSRMTGPSMQGSIGEGCGVPLSS